MRLVSFDVFRTLGFPDTQYFKPEHLFRHKAELSAADWVLYPEYWQLNALHYGLKCRIFPSVSTYLIGHDKIEMTRAFESVVPEHLPLTLIYANTPVARDEIWCGMTPPFVAKLPRSSMGQGIWLIESRQDWAEYCGRTDVLYAQEYLPIDRDLRIVVAGEQIIASYWRRQAVGGFYNNLSRGAVVDNGPVPSEALELVQRVAGQLDINHAGFDVAVIDGFPYLLEFNRLFGNQGIENRDLLKESILDYLRQYGAPRDPDCTGGFPFPPPLKQAV